MPPNRPELRTNVSLSYASIRERASGRLPSGERAAALHIRLYRARELYNVERKRRRLPVRSGERDRREKERRSERTLGEKIGHGEQGAESLNRGREERDAGREQTAGREGGEGKKALRRRYRRRCVVVRADAITRPRSRTRCPLAVI